MPPRGERPAPPPPPPPRHRSATTRLRRTTRPGTCTFVDDLPPVGGHAGWHVGTAPLDFEIRGDRISASRPHTPACVARNDAPLIGERAATRGRCATAGGDEHAGLKSALSVRAPASRNRIERPEPRSVGGHSTA